MIAESIAQLTKPDCLLTRTACWCSKNITRLQKCFIGRFVHNLSNQVVTSQTDTVSLVLHFLHFQLIAQCRLAACLHSCVVPWCNTVSSHRIARMFLDRFVYSLRNPNTNFHNRSPISSAFCVCCCETKKKKEKKYESVSLHNDYNNRWINTQPDTLHLVFHHSKYLIHIQIYLILWKLYTVVMSL